MSGSQDSIKKLLDAQTVRDVMQAGLPLKVGTIPDVDAFNAFAKGSDGDWKTSDITEAFDAGGNLSPKDNDPRNKPDEHTEQTLGGVKKLATASEVQALGDRLAQSQLYSRANAHSKGLPGNAHTDIIDMNSPFNNFRGRNYVASSEQSTLIVPDEAALEIVREFPFSEILDAKFDDPQDRKRIHRAYHQFSETNFEEGGFTFDDNRIDPETAKYMKEMHSRLQACLEPTEDGTLSLMSNITFHARNLPFAKGRVFFQAIGFDDPKNTLDM